MKTKSERIYCKAEKAKQCEITGICEINAHASEFLKQEPSSIRLSTNSTDKFCFIAPEAHILVINISESVSITHVRKFCK